MEQRLIDANALKKEVGSTFHGAIGLTVTGAVHEIIDRQPTIDPESLRPTAHWVHKQAKIPGGVLPVEECSLCECQAWHKTSFCPHCGARMKMED